MKKFLSLMLVLAMLFSLAIPALADDEAPVEAAPYTVPDGVAGKLVILHTNDVHGAVENYAKVATLKEMFVKAGAEVLLVDAGDFSQGETYVSTTLGKSAVELMNAVGYDLAAPGNHEFDYGYENLKSLVELAQFPVLAANVKYEGELAFGNHVVVEKAGKKIGVFGLDTPETATKAHPAKIKGVTFDGGEDLYTVAQAEVAALKAENVDMIVCLSHLGIDDESAANGNRSVDMLAKVEGIDLLIDGHSHSTLEQVKEAEGVTDGKVGATVITSTGTKIANVGVIIVDETGAVTVDSVAAAAIPVAEDNAVAAAAKAVKDKVDAEYGATFAKSEVDLNGDRAPGNRTEETNLGDLICDAMLWQATKDGELDVPKENVIALTNGGGIRASIAAGDISKNDVNKVLPFGNTVAVVYITGEALLEALEASTFCTPTAVGGFPQVAAIDFTVNTAYDYDAAENYPGTTYAAPKSLKRITINSVNGKDFEAAANYAVVTNDFTAAGGDTYYTFSTSPKITDTGVPLDEALMAYITEVLNGVVGEKYAKPQGRITIENRPADLDENAWWYDAAIYCLDRAMMTGTDLGFEAKGTVTDAQVYQIIYNLEGRPSVEEMTTVAEGKWYSEAMTYAAEKNLYAGTDYAGPSIINRSQVAQLLYQYAQMKGWSATANEEVEAAPDYDSVPADNVEAVDFCYAASLMVGDDDGNLTPNVPINRGEMAQVLVNLDAFATTQTAAE